MIDRESFKVLSQDHQGVLNYVSEMYKDKNYAVFGTPEFFPQETWALSIRLSSGKNDCFVITEKTAIRVCKMNVDSVLTNHDTISLIVRNDSQGYIVCPANGINCEYIIDNGRLYMRCYHKHNLAGFCLFSIDIDDGICDIYPWSPITAIVNRVIARENGTNDDLLEMGVSQERIDSFYILPHGEPYRSQFKSRMENIVASIGGEDNIIKMFNRTMKGGGDVGEKFSRDIRNEFADYYLKRGICATSVAMLVFLKTAQVFDKEYKSDIPSTYARKKGVKKLDYCVVDSTWDTNINVNNPFAVRGHFRHQPKKDENGDWFKDLIYIDSFMKNGYHRRATKTIYESNKR